MNPSSKIETITPELAAEMLTKKRMYRKVNVKMVEKLTHAIIANEFLTTHQGIALDVEGYLMDGQNKLTAIIKANKPIELMVSRNYPKESIYVIDRFYKRKP